MKAGIKLIAEERKRQKEVEGWTAENDKKHSNGELATAAVCYALPAMNRYSSSWRPDIPVFWPWENKWWKPTPNDRLRELVKAGALIAAEIDRLQNLKSK